MLRPDLQVALLNSGINLQKLSSYQRILLTTDGTLTDILEAYVWEPIEIVKLMQENLTVPKAIPHLDIATHTEVLHREVLLRGTRSAKNYLHATSLLVLDRLDPDLREDLITTQEPLGKLMIQARLETFREIVRCSLQKAVDMGKFFGEPPDSELISRTYRIFTRSRPFILITESFPGSYFRD
ncbi:MAG: chorismate pyruvate-lyase family protein [Gammaproteobacteria bacterium]|jgi:chorismate-pyruvate lyase